jgi:hypothetical protein
MLAGVIFYVALIALVATTILSAGLAMTRMTVTRMAQPFIAAGYQRALNSLQQTIAADVQSGVPFPTPTFAPLGPACANAACTYTTTETIALAQSASPTPGPSCDPGQTNCALNVQTNAYVSESRLSAVVTVTVSDARGAVIATRSLTAALRTFDAPPYVALAGAGESAFDDAGSRAIGDDGGAAPATPNPCASASAGVADDTSVRVAYRNEKTAACSDGSTWGNASYSSGAGASGWR